MFLRFLCTASFLQILKCPYLPVIRSEIIKMKEHILLSEYKLNSMELSLYSLSNMCSFIFIISGLITGRYGHFRICKNDAVHRNLRNIYSFNFITRTGDGPKCFYDEF